MHEISQFIEYVDNFAQSVVLEALKMHGSIFYLIFQCGYGPGNLEYHRSIAVLLLHCYELVLQ